MGLRQSCAAGVGAAVVVLVTAVPPIVPAEDAGRLLFNAKCSVCHLTNGTGRKTSKMAVANLRSREVQSLSDQELYDSIAHGARHKDYPHAFLYTGMTEDQIKSVIAYIRTFQ